jgi:acyl dehydratase
MSPAARGDYNPLHWDPDFAAQVSPTGGIIAHGMLNMGLVSRAVTDWAGGPDCVLRLSTAFRAPCPVGATVTIELENEGSRPHNFSVAGQGIDLNCGVRARGEVEVAFPRTGVLAFTCKYGATSGMRGALAVR